MNPSAFILGIRLLPSAGGERLCCLTTALLSSKVSRLSRVELDPS